MSVTTGNQGNLGTIEHVTQEAVQAAILSAAGGSATAIAAATAAAASLAAPSSTIEAWLANLEARMVSTEATLGKIAPIVQNALDDAAPVVGALVPAAAPLIAKLPAIEHTVGLLLKALNLHFGGKLGAPTAIVAPPAAPGA